MVKGLAKEQVVYTEGLKQQVFDFLKKSQARQSEGLGDSFKEKKLMFEAFRIYYCVHIKTKAYRNIALRVTISYSWVGSQSL